MPNDIPADDFDYKAAFTALMQQNQLLMQQLLARDEASSARLMHELSSRIPMFQCDDDSENAFTTWYDRHVKVFTVDAESLSDSERVRLLLERLQPEVFEKYKSHMLPKVVFDIEYENTVKVLKEFFDKSSSLFTQRYQLLRHDKVMSQDLLSYMSEINSQCEKAKIGKLSSDDWKCLIFVYGLKHSSYFELRKRLVIFLDQKHRDNKSCSLKELYEEGERFLGTINDARLIGAQSRSEHPEVCQVTYKDCWNCGGNHLRSLCPKPKWRCSKCKGTGHKEEYCKDSNRWSSKKKYGSDDSDQEYSQSSTRGRHDRKSNRQPQRNSKHVRTVDIQSVTVPEVQSSVDGHSEFSEYYKKKPVHYNDEDYLYSRRKNPHVPDHKILYSVKSSEKPIPRLTREVRVNGIPVKFEVDTCADGTLISKSDWIRLGCPRLSKSQSQFTSASGDPMNILGVFPCKYEVNCRQYSGVVHVTPCDVNLFGRDWINSVPELKHAYQLLAFGSPVQLKREECDDSQRFCNSKSYGDSYEFCLSSQSRSRLPVSRNHKSTDVRSQKSSRIYSQSRKQTRFPDPAKTTESHDSKDAQHETRAIPVRSSSTTTAVQASSVQSSSARSKHEDRHPRCRS